MAEETPTGPPFLLDEFDTTEDSVSDPNQLNGFLDESYLAKISSYDNELGVHDAFIPTCFPDIWPLGTDAHSNIMASRNPAPCKQKFKCPWFEAETVLELPHSSCTGLWVENMAEVRRHMVRRHLSFLRLCQTCNKLFMEEIVFENAHGDRCNNPQKQCRGEAAKAMWAELYNDIFKMVKEGRPTQIRESIHLEPQTEPPLEIFQAQPLAYHQAQPPITFPDSIETPSPSGLVGTPARHYTVPYALIFDSDSEEERAPELNDESPAIYPPTAEFNVNRPSPTHFDDTWRRPEILHSLYPDILEDLRGISSDPIPSAGHQAELFYTGTTRIPEPIPSLPPESSMQSDRQPNQIKEKNSFYNDDQLGSDPLVSNSVDSIQSTYSPRRFVCSNQSDSGTSSATVRLSDQDVNVSESPMSIQILGPASWEGASSPSPSVMSGVSSACPDPLACPECGTEYSGEYRKGNLARHIRLKHGDGEQLYVCETTSCAKGFKRQDARLKHYRRRHPELAQGSPLLRRL